jgi:hypothetical protein
MRRAIVAQQVAAPPGHHAVMTIGSEVSLCQPQLLDWVVHSANADESILAPALAGLRGPPPAQVSM